MRKTCFTAALIIMVLFGAPIRVNAQAQSVIKGLLIDEQTQTIPGATVLLKSGADSILYRSTISTSRGVFILNAVKNGSYYVEVRVVGFKKLVVSNIVINESNKTIDLGALTLINDNKTLSGVTINVQTPPIEHQIDKTIVNVAQNITNEGSTVLELMQKLPGVQVGADGQITMNGKSGVNVYMDGKTTYLSSSDLVNILGGMPASDIQKIEIMTNPSSKYDAAGASGIINIVKKKNRKEGFNGSANTGFTQGYYGRYNGGFTLSYKNQNYNLFFNNTYNFNKSFTNRTVVSDISGAGNNLLTEQLSNTDGRNIGKNYRPTLGIDLYLSKRTTLTVSGTGGFGLSNSQLFSTMDILNSTHNKINHQDFASRLKDNPFNYTLGIQLEHQLDTSGKSLTIDADHSEYRNYPNQNNLNTLNDANNNFVSETDALLLQHRQLDIYAAKADYVQPLKNKGSFEAGIKSSYVKANNNNTYYDQFAGRNVIDLPQSNYSINSENINAAYINLNQNYQKLTLQAGLRTEQTITKGKQVLSGELVDQSYIQLFPTLFLNYKINDQNSFNTRLGRRISRVSYSEMVPFRRPQTATLYFEGNPNLKPDISYHAEITWALKNAFFITFGYDIDRDYLRTFPYLDSNKITITRRPTNVQGAHSWNVDLAYSKKLTDWWSTDNTVSLFQNSFSGEAAGFSLDNPGIASIYLQANNSFHLNSKLSAEVDFEYDSKRQVINSTFGAYSVLSAGLKQQVLNNKGSVSINANNILHSESHNAIDRNAGLYQYSYLRFYTSSIGLNFSYRFGSGKTAKPKLDSGSADEQKRAGN